MFRATSRLDIGIRFLACLVGLAAITPAVLGSGCAKVIETSGGGGNAGSGSTGAGGNHYSSGAGGSVGRGGTAGGGIRPDAGPCMQASFTFAPKIPTVFILVDQSGSMFGCRNGGATDATGACLDHSQTAWYPLKDGVLQVIMQLQKDVRFGFAAFTGEKADAVCPVLKPVLPALNNYDAIAANYNALTPPKKGETPTRKALDQVDTILTADASPGDRFILFVTDGQPDYCDDSNETCAPDSVVGGLQQLYSADKIRTLVFGIAASSSLTTISGPVLQAFANAGAGQPVLPPLGAGKTLDAYFYECANMNLTMSDPNSHIQEWTSDFNMTGKTLAAGQSIGNYSTTSGNATLYRPDPANQQALITQFTSALSGVKSCIFDLNGLDHPLKVNLDLINLAHVTIQGVDIPLGTGWQMDSATQLELIGDGCATWRKPESTTIDFQFPCEVIIPG